jgi:hypothetical protein
MTAANQKTRLFTVRLWQAALDDGPAKLEWRGKVQSLPDGEVYYFRDWPGLIRRLEALLASEAKLSSDLEIQNGGTS